MAEDDSDVQTELRNFRVKTHTHTHLNIPSPRLLNLLVVSSLYVALCYVVWVSGRLNDN